MKLKLLIFLLALYHISILAQSTTIKSAEISFNFESKDVDGNISGFTSDSTIDLENLENSKLKGSVTVKTIKTGIFLRDWSLKGGKYFDEDLHPKIHFESTSVAATADGFLVKGNVTIKSIEKPMSITFKKNGNQLTGTTSLYSSDFGINIKKAHEENKVTIKMVFELD